MNTKGQKIYEGKAKIVYAVEGRSDLCWVEYKDSLTAFNAQKKGSFAAKGILNRNIASRIFAFLKERGVDNHWLENKGEREMICRQVEIVPIEVVVRNRLAGSTAKKFGIEEGREIAEPLVEFYFKKDELGDPFMSDDQALAIGAARNRGELDELKRQALVCNKLLQEFFKKIGVELIDFKLEFGRRDGKVLLADEVSPDTCRLWDLATGEKLDKDRFRRDLGRVEESYQEIWQRIQSAWGANV